jgi:curved DNA-binding protein CbpA
MRRAAPPTSKDYYEILRVGPKATSKEIRAAFKRLMLAEHPDKNPERREWSERRVRDLIEAFDVLANSQARAKFDVELGRMRSGSASYRKKSPEESLFFFRKADSESKALRILYYLTHRKLSPALEVLSEMQKRHGPTFLRDYLDRQDYLDSLFLLAEGLASRRSYVEAARHLSELYAYERSSRFPRHYLGEVLRLLKDLYLRKIPRGKATSRVVIEGLQAAGSLPLSPAEDRARLEKLALAHFQAGDLAAARVTLDRLSSRLPLPAKLENIRKKMETAR